MPNFGIPTDLLSSQRVNQRRLKVQTEAGAQDYFVEVARGNVLGQELIELTAINPDLDTNEPDADIWGGGEDALGIAEPNLIYPTAGEQWEVVSTDPLDSAGTSGAREIVVTYLDDQFNEQTELVTLNGTNAVEMVATNCYRPTSIAPSTQPGILNSESPTTRVTQVGSSGANIGYIKIRQVGGGPLRQLIRPLQNRAQDCHYTVPAGKEIYIMGFYSSVQKGKDASIQLAVNYNDSGIFLRGSPLGLFQNSIVVLGLPIGPFPEKTSIKWICNTENNNTICSISGQILIIDK